VVCPLFYCANLEGVDPRQGYDKSLQTLLLNRFYLKGGLGAILEIIQSLAENLPLLDKNNSDDSESLLALPADFKKAISITRLFTTDMVINESPHTALLSNRDRHKGQGHYFVTSAFLTDNRTTCLPVFTQLLSFLNLFDKTTAQTLLSTISELILGGPEEFQTEANKYEGEPEEDSIHRISQNGFDRGQVYASLMAHGNVEAAALEALLNRRNPPANARSIPVHPRSRSISPPIAGASNERANAANAENPGVGLDLPSIFQPPSAENDNQAMDVSVPETSDEMADIRMQIDTPATSAPSNDKGKQTEVAETRAATLARLRTEFSNNLENYITDILVHHPDLPFELARLIQSVGQRESNEWLQEKMLELAARLASMEDDKATKGKEITACAHVQGLLLSETRYYKAAEGGIIGFLDSFASFLNVEDGIEAPWLAPVMFIIEVVMRENEWRQSQKRHSVLPPDTDVPEIEDEFYCRLVEKLVDLLNSDPSDTTVIICVLRLLIRLTREGRYARLFREKNGIQSLLHLNHQHAGKASLKISDPSIIIIRHIVEDDKIVLAIMRSVIQNVLDTGAHRGRHVDLNELLRNKYAEVLRNPELFSHAVAQLAKLVGWSSSNPQNHKLTKKQAESIPVADGAKKDVTIDSTDAKPLAPETPKKSTLELNYSSGVVQVLLTELLSHHTDTPASLKKEDAPNVGHTTSPEDTTELGHLTVNPTTPPKLAPEENKEYAYTLFLLQVLSELLGSYNNCKLEFVNYSRRGQSREPLTPSKPRSMMLNCLLNDLLPTGSVSYTSQSSQDMNLQKKRGISQLSASVISALCRKTPELYEVDERPDLLVTVRKFVLEGIARSIKDTLASTSPTHLRYSRYTSLAELCRKLLASLVLPIQTLPPDINTSSEMAKLMFEKGFVNLLTNVIADIELDFPDVKAVVNDILASLRDLTTSVNRLAANSALEVGTASGDIEEISTASSVSEEEEMHDRDETPDVFRNSALGILQGVVEDQDHHNHHHGFEDYDDEMDYDEDDDADDEDDDLDDSGSEDDEMDEDDDDGMDVSTNFDCN
jgi:E3 ubiquitin-protein ligase HUWE1